MEEVAGSSSKIQVQSRIGILDLPLETQHHILKHCHIIDLIALALVSRYFNEIASAKLYRHFLIYFDDEDTIEPEPWDDALASILDSMVTSDRKYAKHLRNLNFDSPNGGKKGEREYRDYSYTLSCGKFMNTLLVLVIRQAVALETFHWNVRVEISPSLFQALQSISTLQKLHVRLQRGPPMFKLPKPWIRSLSYQVGHIPSFTPSLTLPMYHSHDPVSSTPKSVPTSKPQKPKQMSVLSGFSSLKSLSVLDIDDLYYIDGMAECLQACSSTLKHLKLSLSEDLASKSRKPPIPDTDDSDQDVDDFGIPLPPPHVTDWSQEKEVAAKKELVVQESLLSTIFGVQPLLPGVSSKSDPLDVEKKPDSEEFIKDNEAASSAESELAGTFFTNLKGITERYLNSTKGGYTAGNNLKAQRETLYLIHEAASKYATSQGQDLKGLDGLQGPIMIHENLPVLTSTPSEGTGQVGSTTGVGTGGLSRTNLESSTDADANPKTQTTETSLSLNPPDDASEPGLFDKTKDAPKLDVAGSDLEVSNPEDINIEVPEVIEEEDGVMTPNSPPSQDLESVKEITMKDDDLTLVAKKLSQSAIDGSGTGSTIPPAATVQQSKNKSQAEESEAPRGNENDPSTAEKTTDSQATSASKEYIRSTRGLALEDLSLYLIPIKASVLSKAIDFSVLTRVTLLNVGPQDAFWTLVANENKKTPLPLQCIFSDNVTASFLSCIQGLNKVTDLLMLERNSEKPDVESLAPKTVVSIKEIRRTVLRKHAKHLRRLMIKNEHILDNMWDADAGTTMLLATKASKLEELAISLELRIYHLLLQNISGLLSLRALHILRIDVYDSHPSVLQEIRQGVIDSVAHHPKLQLEYVACDNTVDRIRRHDEMRRRREASKALKGKKPEVDVVSKGEAQSLDEPVLASDANANHGLSDSGESETDEIPPVLDLRETKFYRTGNIRIFRKDIRSGKL